MSQNSYESTNRIFFYRIFIGELAWPRNSSGKGNSLRETRKNVSVLNGN